MRTLRQPLWSIQFSNPKQLPAPSHSSVIISVEAQRTGDKC